MAYTQSDLDALDRAIASGELSVEVAGRKVVYRSADDLLKLRATVSQLLTQAATPVGNRAAKHFTFATLRER
jgi:hypothetical protein